MPTQATREPNQSCTCAEWDVNMAHLRSLPGTHWAAFRFCPWCGQRLSGVTGRRNKAMLEKCRHGIREIIFARDEWGMPQSPNLLGAARLITSYRHATGWRHAGGDILGTLDLMLAFVETGTRFTLEFGHMDESLYAGLELLLDDFRELLLAHPELYAEADLAQRLAQLVRDGGGLAWGYGDYVTEQVARIQQHFGDV